MSEKILIVDDEEDILDLLEDALESEDFRIKKAHHGKEALEILKGFDPDLIILDVNMPVMDGAEFYEKIYDPVLKKTRYPVLMLTARAQIKPLFSQLAIDGFMTKPFKVDRLLDQIILILNRDGRGQTEPRLRQSREKKVLLVEKDENRFHSLVVNLAKEGYAVTAATNGVDAIEYAMEQQPSLILINLSLPDIPGDTLASRLKRLAATRHIPLAVYRAASDKMNEEVTKKLVEKVEAEHFIFTDEPVELIRKVKEIMQEIIKM